MLVSVRHVSPRTQSLCQGYVDVAQVCVLAAGGPPTSCGTDSKLIGDIDVSLAVEHASSLDILDHIIITLPDAPTVWARSLGPRVHR